MISIHTFELAKEADSKCFNNLLSSAYKKAKKNKNRVGYSTKHTTGDVRIDDRFSSDGITIEYHSYEFRKMIKLCINPSKVLGGNDLKLWEPSLYNTELLIDEISECIEDYFDCLFDINDFDFTRVDFTSNVNVGKKNVKAYIAFLHKIGKVKNFVPKYNRADYKNGRIDKEDSFDLKGKTNFIEFTAYDSYTAFTENLRNDILFAYSLKISGCLALRALVSRRSWDTLFQDIILFPEVPISLSPSISFRRFSAFCFLSVTSVSCSQASSYSFISASADEGSTI